MVEVYFKPKSDFGPIFGSNKGLYWRQKSKSCPCQYVTWPILHAFRELNKFGIKTQEDYIRGDWYGNSTISAREIFNSVTYELRELLTKFSVLSEMRWQNFAGDFKDLNYGAIGHVKFGQCFEINIAKKDKLEKIQRVKIIFKKPLMVFITLPWQFLYSHENFQVHLGTRISIHGNFI